MSKSNGTGEMYNRTTSDSLASYNPFKNIRQFISLEKSFLKQLEEDDDIFQNQNTFLLQEKMKISAEALLDCMPDKVSLRLTDVGSIFYTIIKNDLKIYFQHFLIEEFDESDEAIISIFSGNENVLNYAGSLLEVISEFSKYMSSKNIATRQLA